MKVICAWCQRELEGGPYHDEAPDAEISHGLCESCRSHFFQGGDRSTLGEFLNKLAAPVLLMDPQGAVIHANDAALHLLGKPLDRVAGFRGGDAMECMYSRLPGGCGNTIHCKTCTIRRNVTETFRTGKCLRRVPAYLDRYDNGGSQRIAFLISTEKVNDTVLLRIDEVNP